MSSHQGSSSTADSTDTSTDPPIKVEIYLGIQNGAYRGNTKKWVIEIDAEDLEFCDSGQRDTLIEERVKEAVDERVEWDWTILS